MSISAVTKSPMTPERMAVILIQLGWKPEGNDFRHSGWLIYNIRAMQSAPHWGGHTHTLVEVCEDTDDGDAPPRVLADALTRKIPTWTPDCGDQYHLGWHDAEPLAGAESAAAAPATAVRIAWSVSDRRKVEQFRIALPIDGGELTDLFKAHAEKVVEALLKEFLKRDDIERATLTVSRPTADDLRSDFEGEKDGWYRMPDKITQANTVFKAIPPRLQSTPNGGPNNT